MKHLVQAYVKPLFRKKKRSARSTLITGLAVLLIMALSITPLIIPAVDANAATLPDLQPYAATTLQFSDAGPVNADYDLRRSLWVDVNNDGYEDLIGYSTWNPYQLRLLINQHNSSFTDETAARGLSLSSPNIHHITPFDLENDGDFDLWIGDQENGSSSSRLFINDGSGHFTNSGVSFPNGSKGSAAADVDGDGDIDLVDMGNDETVGGTLYLNQNGSLSQTTDRFDGGRPHGYQGPIFVDFDNDGDLDMYTTANYYGHNHLYQNDGQGVFQDVTAAYNLSFQSESHGTDGAVFADFDNDGDMDLLAIEGEVKGNDVRMRIWILENRPGPEFVQVFSFDRTFNNVNAAYAPDAAMVADFDNDGDLDFWPVGQSHIFLNNLVQGYRFNFETTTKEVPIPSNHPSRTASIADPDHDGDIDIFYAAFNGENGEGDDLLHWYRNDLNPDANWLQVNLVGHAGDAGGYGVRISIYPTGHAGDVEYLVGMRAASSGCMYHASLSRILHFGGLDPEQKYDLIVRAPNQQGEFSIPNVSPGQRIDIDVSELSMVTPTPGPSATTTPPEQTFLDVPVDHRAFDSIEALYAAGLTSGCSETEMLYCPEQNLKRNENAVFGTRAMHGSTFTPVEPAVPYFTDVLPGEWYTSWVEFFSEEGYTDGCGVNPPRFCPFRELTLKEMAVYAVRYNQSWDVNPPTANGIFSDIALEDWSTPWLEYAYSLKLIDACETQPELKICPDAIINRARAAVIIVRALGLLDPKLTPTPGSSITPDPTITPDLTVTPDPTVTPGPSPTPSPTPPTVAPSLTPIPSISPSPAAGWHDPVPVITFLNEINEGDGSRDNPYIIHSTTVRFRLDDSYDPNGIEDLSQGGIFYPRIHSGRFLGCGIVWSENDIGWNQIDDQLFSVDLPEIGFYNVRLTITDRTGRKGEIKIFIYTNVSPTNQGPEPAGNNAPLPVVDFKNVVSGNGSSGAPFVIRGDIAHFNMLNSTDPDSTADIRNGTFHYSLYFTDGEHPLYETGYTYSDMQSADFTLDMNQHPNSTHYRVVAFVIDQWGRYGSVTVKFKPEQ